MSERIINFDNKKIRISDFYKSIKIFDIDEIDINKILVSKKNHTVQREHLNTLLNIMIMMLLDHYI